MLQYQLDNHGDKYAVVYGVGVVEPGESRVFESDSGAGFERQTGLKLTQDNLPDNLELTVIVLGEED